MDTERLKFIRDHMKFRFLQHGNIESAYQEARDLWDQITKYIDHMEKPDAS